jgi:hypothetical protein
MRVARSGLAMRHCTVHVRLCSNVPLFNLVLCSSDLIAFGSLMSELSPTMGRPALLAHVCIDGSTPTAFGLGHGKAFWLRQFNGRRHGAKLSDRLRTSVA